MTKISNYIFNKIYNTNIIVQNNLVRCKEALKDYKKDLELDTK